MYGGSSIGARKAVQSGRLEDVVGTLSKRAVELQLAVDQSATLPRIRSCAHEVNGHLARAGTAHVYYVIFSGGYEHGKHINMGE